MMGYSSGATAIQYLVSSPKLQDHRLFSQAMIDSGLPIMAPYFNREVTEKFLEVNGVGFLFWDFIKDKLYTILILRS
jgi:hypothetical protein